MKLESPKVTIGKSSHELFDYLSQIENFGNIMPDNTDKFEATGDSFVFALKGMPEIRLNMIERESPRKIVLGSASDKFPFSLTADINDLASDQSEAQLLFDGEFNPMVAMMVKGPLQKFINTLSENIAKL